MIPSAAHSTAHTAAPASAPMGAMGAQSAPRQWLPSALPVASGAQSDAMWLWRCVEIADQLGYTAQNAHHLGCGARHHADAYSVHTPIGGVYHVTYTPRQSDAATFASSYAHDGVWRCQCPRSDVGAPCAHVGAAYLLACRRDVARAQRQAAVMAQARQTQAQMTVLDERLSDMKLDCIQQAAARGWDAPDVRQLDEAIRYYELRYRAMASQMARLITSATTALYH